MKPIYSSNESTSMKIMTLNMNIPKKKYLLILQAFGRKTQNSFEE